MAQFYAHLLSHHPSLTPFPIDYQSPRPEGGRPQARECLHPIQPFGRFEADLYGSAIEGYQQQTVTMAVLANWEGNVLRGILSDMCKSEGPDDGRRGNLAI